MSYRLLFFLVLFSVSVQAQNWSGILDPSRAVDWSQAGVQGGIPSASWTQCGSTIPAGASVSTIQSTINNCGAHQYVLLGAGTFNLNNGLTLKSNVVLRGQGADQTSLVFTNSIGCWSGGALVCFNSDTTWAGDPGSPETQWGGSQAATWSGGYTQGTTGITLTNVGSNGIVNGQWITLDQVEATSDNGNLFVCSNTSTPCSLEGGPVARVSNGTRSQQQVVQVTAGCSSKCSGSGPFTVTISPGIYAPNWSTGQHPGAWWIHPNQYAGLENLSLDGTNSGDEENIGVLSCVNCWVTGVRSVNSNRDHINFAQSAHITAQNNYFYGTQNAASQSYGVEFTYSSDNLIQNNIFQKVTTPYLSGDGEGEAFLYNYTIFDYYNQSAGWLIPAVNSGHDAASMYNLYEGNVMSGWNADVFHGTSGMNTGFRNALPGWEPGITQARWPIYFSSYVRYQNIIGNVLGMPGIQTSCYQQLNTDNSDPCVFTFGAGNTEGSVTVPSDSKVGTTVMRWGNYDTVNKAVRFVASEVPSGISPYGNAVPSSQTLPPSFYYSFTPAWWPSGKPWPLIGPDVTGGNVGQCSGGTYNHAFALSSGQCSGGTFVANVNGGHMNSNPAMDCYLNVLNGPLDGSGGALTFNANACYPSSGSGDNPSPPSGLQATVN